MPTVFIWIRTTFVGFHRWKDAPTQVAFLRDYHRHIFHVRLGKEVTNPDRQIEFFTLKQEVDDYLTATYLNQYFDLSCEQIAIDLWNKFNAFLVEVSEDGENGATVVPSGPVTNEDWRLQQYGTTPQSQSALETTQELLKVAKEPQSHPKVKVTEGGDEIWRGKTIRRGCFAGIEAEGPFRGKRTLFVPGSTSPEEFNKAYQVCYNLPAVLGIVRVYYGAGNDRNMRNDTLLAIRSIFADGDITIEVDSMDYITDPTVSAMVTFVSMDPEDIHRASYVKEVKDEKIRWVNIEGTEYVTLVTDPMFKQDTYC